jgi:hypothetical protein
VEHYSEAIHLAPDAGLLYANRSAALLARNWEGDAWWALQDCERALQLAPNNYKSAYRRIQALKALGHLQVRALQTPSSQSALLSWFVVR